MVNRKEQYSEWLTREGVQPYYTVPFNNSTPWKSPVEILKAASELPKPDLPSDRAAGNEVDEPTNPDITQLLRCSRRAATFKARDRLMAQSLCED